MIRYLLSDESWSRLKEIMFHFKIYNKLNLRKVVDWIQYRMRTGIPWRDLPAEFGCWNSVSQQFNQLSSRHINIVQVLQLKVVKRLGNQ